MLIGMSKALAVVHPETLSFAASISCVQLFFDPKLTLVVVCTAPAAHVYTTRNDVYNTSSVLSTRRKCLQHPQWCVTTTSSSVYNASSRCAHR